MGFFDSLKDTGNLVKQTFVMIGRNPEIFKPTIAQIVLGLIFYVIILVSLAFMFLSSALQGIGIILLIISVIFLFLIFPFMRIYYKAAQCWVVYNTVSGKKCTYKEGIARARKNKWDIFVIGVIDIVVNIVVSKIRESKSFLAKIVAAIIGEAWDLIGNFLLPAAIIKDQTVRQAVPELKNLRKNIPGAVAGTLGFDFVGGIALFYINFILVIITILVGLFGFFTLSSYVPLVIMIILLIGINIVLAPMVQMLKTIYFTLLYISVTMPSKISPKYRKEVTHYIETGKRKK